MRARHLFLLFTMGCYNTYAVRPTELVKLNEMHTGAATTSGMTVNGRSRTTTTAIPSMRSVLTTDGRTAEIVGEPDVTLDLADGRRITFGHPLIVSLSDQQVMEIAGGNQPLQAIPLQAIRSAEVKSFNRTKTFLVMGGIVLAAILTTTVFILTTGPDGP